MLEHIVSDGDEGILLDEHFAILHNDGEAIDIGIDHETDIGNGLAHTLGDLTEVLRDRFGSVSKLAVGFAVEFYNILNAEGA